jgi:hypothetical protein
MPNVDDAELTQLITVHTGGTVEDNAPNTPPPGGAVPPGFDLLLQAAAGNTLGSSGAGYTLTITAFDQTTGAPVPAMNPVGQPFAQNFDAGSGWAAGGPTEYVNVQRFPIVVPPAVAGHVFTYVASLVSNNQNEASLIDSNQFVLV